MQTLDAYALLYIYLRTIVPLHFTVIFNDNGRNNTWIADLKMIILMQTPGLNVLMYSFNLNFYFYWHDYVIFLEIIVL